MAGIKDVAARAGVAMSTVSYVMSGKRSVKSETKIRVLQAARELGYYSNSGARTLRGKAKRIIALSSPMHSWTDYTNYSVFFFGVANRAKKHGYDVLLLMGEDEADDLERISDSGLVDGVLLLDVALDDERVERAKVTRVPVVSIGCSDNDSGVISVDLDFELMGSQAVDLAYGLGHRHMLYLGDGTEAYAHKSNFLIRTRESIKAEAKRRGMSVSESYLANGDMQDLQSHLDHALQVDPQISVIFAQCNLEAIGNAIQALRDRHYEVPRDMSILALGTFGNAGALTVPIDEMPMMPFVSCGRAVDVLMDVLAGKRSDFGAVDKIAPKYIPHGSLVAPRR